jgi:hypothetical protein
MQIVYPLYPWSSDFIHDLNAAIGILDSTFTADIKVRLQIGYGVDARTGDPLTDQNTSYAAPSQLYPLSYSDLSNNLKAAIPGFFNDNNLPEGSSIDSISDFNVAAAQARAFGIISAHASDSDIDGYVSIGTGFSAGPQRIGAILHEITHALGRESDTSVTYFPIFPFFPTTHYSSFDLFRFLSGRGSRFR